MYITDKSDGYGDGIIELVKGEIKAGFAPEYILDAYCGWAGDLQTVMVDTKHVLGDNADYDSFKAVMKDLIGCDENTIYEKYPELVETKCHFPIPDVYADVDAANIFELLTDRDADGESLGVVLVELAKSKKGERFIVWPLFKYDIVQNEQKVTKWYKFNAEESNAAYVAYTEFLMERVKDEE